MGWSIGGRYCLSMGIVHRENSDQSPDYHFKCWMHGKMAVCSLSGSYKYPQSSPNNAIFHPVLVNISR